jgi:hypothetical protein
MGGRNISYKLKIENRRILFWEMTNSYSQPISQIMHLLILRCPYTDPNVSSYVENGSISLPPLSN